jgi:hypothetical protein
LSGENVSENCLLYLTDPGTAPEEIKFQEKRYEPNIMNWLAIPSRSVSDVYTHCGKQAARQDTHLQQFIDKRLLPFIEKHHADGYFLFRPDLAATHHSNGIQQRLTEKKCSVCHAKGKFPERASSTSYRNCLRITRAESARE